MEREHVDNEGRRHLLEGECDCCGKCCEVFTFNLTPQSDTPQMIQQYWPWFRYLGTFEREGHGGPTDWWMCGALGPNEARLGEIQICRCTIHQSADRPELCDGFPYRPADRLPTCCTLKWREDGTAPEPVKVAAG